MRRCAAVFVITLLARHDGATHAPLSHLYFSKKSRKGTLWCWGACTTTHAQLVKSSCYCRGRFFPALRTLQKAACLSMCTANVQRLLHETNTTKATSKSLHVYRLPFGGVESRVLCVAGYRHIQHNRCCQFRPFSRLVASSLPYLSHILSATRVILCHLAISTLKHCQAQKLLLYGVLLYNSGRSPKSTHKHLVVTPVTLTCALTAKVLSPMFINITYVAVFTIFLRCTAPKKTLLHQADDVLDTHLFRQGPFSGLCENSGYVCRAHEAFAVSVEAEKRLTDHAHGLLHPGSVQY